MVKVKNVESKVSPSKINITATDIAVVNGVFEDENGNIAQEIDAILKENGVDTFTLKISIELPTEE